MSRRDFLKIIIFILIFLSINKIASDLFVKWSRADMKDGIAIRRFEEIQENIDVIILGDSHPQLSVMAAKLPGGYNFTSGAESYILNYYKVKYYLKHGAFMPKVAVLPIDLHSFMPYRIERVISQDPALWNRYVDYWEFGRETGTLVDLVPAFTDAYFPLLGAVDVFGMVIWPSESPPILVEGYLPTDQDFSTYPPQIQEEITTKRVDGQVCSSPFNIDERMVGYFYRLLDLLDENDIQVVLVWYPITEQYYEKAGRCVNVEEHLTSVKELLVGRQPALILDYHDLFFGQLEYYSDTDHLNSRGAQIFTELLLEDLAATELLPGTGGSE